MKPEEQMLISAVRYALGRRSYIVNTTCGFIKSVKDKMSQRCIDIIIRDTKEEIERYHRLEMTCGDYCDERDWLELLEVLKGNKNGKL